ncbi:MAG: GNAT family N-acetyltransferase [Alcanivoracaceae bacterium]|nr:GNAT family N-acetyltransferase [Alcanivoracaceae bacterium]
MLNSSKVLAKSFDELTKIELYSILALRVQVFCVEQNCPYQDLDNQDQQSQHIFIKDADVIAVYARVISAEDNVIHIGRVVVNENYRKHGLATIIMKSCINTIRHNNHNKESVTIIVSAQSYLTGFYQGLGFKSTGKFYLEDDIPHEQMQIVVV